MKNDMKKVGIKKLRPTTRGDTYLAFKKFMVGPFSNEETKHLTLQLEGLSQSAAKRALTLAVSSDPGIKSEFHEIGVHILYGIYRLRKKRWNGDYPAPNEVGDALRAGDAPKLAELKKHVDAALADG